MKYLSLKSVASAYDGCYKKTTNQFWSLIAILKVINKQIEPATSYTFKSRDVSEILDNLFTFGKRNNYESITWSILFSNIWKEYMLSNFIRNSPNIYDVAIWLYRKERFEDNINAERLLSAFLDTIHLNKDDILPYFEFDEKEIVFEGNLYDDESLREELSANHEVIFQSEEVNEQGTVVQFEKKTLIFDDKKCIQYAAGNFGQAYVQTLYSAQKVQQCLILTKFDFNSLYKKQINSSNAMDDKQIIIYGAPGTGKSNIIKGEVDDKNKLFYRTTFHPDSDYSTFVGAYKPKMNGEHIIYAFEPQAFTNAYVDAWKTEDDVYLIIEEINRGNCAQIFGDIFQLLDRKNGESVYTIKADSSLGVYLKEKLADSHREIPEKVRSGEELKLPSNLYIWATMNTSDQSLFPIDSAFKRRWDWKYVKIAKGKDRDTKKELDWKVDFVFIEEEKKYHFSFDWWEFVQRINDIIASATSSDDKKLGYFFCQPKKNELGNDIIDAKTFVGKVVFYLWNDVLKEERPEIFKVYSTKGEPSFDSFYMENEDGDTVVDTLALKDFVYNVFGDDKNKIINEVVIEGTTKEEGDGLVLTP